MLVLPAIVYGKPGAFTTGVHPVANAPGSPKNEVSHVTFTRSMKKRQSRVDGFSRMARMPPA